jgi:hypothetical protein
MKLLIIKFSPPSCYFLPVRLSSLFSTTQCSSFDERNQVSHQYKTGKIMSIVIFTLLDKRQDRGEGCVPSVLHRMEDRIVTLLNN